MDPQHVFLVCNYGVLPAWALLALAPGSRVTQRVVHGLWVPLLLAPVYLWALASGLPGPAGGSFATLDGVMKLFTSPYAALAGWVHYLAFDLFVGAWEVRDARRRGISHGWVLPCLVLTLMIGPAGLALYLIVRRALSKAGS